MEDIPEDISALETKAASAESKAKAQPKKSSNTKSSDKKKKHKKSKKGKGGAKKKKKEKNRSSASDSTSQCVSGAHAALAKRVAVSAAAVAALPIVARACPEAVTANALPLSATLMRMLRCDWLDGDEIYAIAGVIAGVHPTYTRGLSLARALQVVSANT